MNRRNKTKQNKKVGKNAERWEAFHLNNNYVPQFTYLVLCLTKEKNLKIKKEGKGNYLHLGDSHCSDSSKDSMIILP